MAKRRVFVTYNSVVREVFPRTVFKYTWDNERDQIFKRKKLASKLLFVNDTAQNLFDFSYFSQIELGGNACAEIKVEVKIKCEGEYVNEWDGYFSTGAGRLDFDKCEFEVQAEPDDKYRCIFEHWERVHNMFDFQLQKVTTSGNIAAVYVTLIGDTLATGVECNGKVRSSEAGNLHMWYNTYSSAQDMIDKGWCMKNHVVTPAGVVRRFRVKCDNVVLWAVGDVIAHSGFPTQTATICKTQTSTLTDPLNNDERYIWVVNNLLPAGNLILHNNTSGDNGTIQSYTDEPFSTVVTTWHCEEYTAPCVSGVCPTLTGNWVLITTGCGGTGTCLFRRCPGAANSTAQYRGVMYETLIESIARINCPDIAYLTSIFLDANPDTTDSHYDAGINYITGLTNRVDELVIAHKSDVINPQASDPATIGNLTLKMLLDWAREVLDCYWDIIFDSNGDPVLRIEHFDFFEQQFSRDLRDPKYKKYVNNKNSYEHLKERIPQFEKWKWVEAAGIDFVGRDIIYSPPCATPGQEVTHSPEQLATDVTYLFNNFNASREGFVMLSTYFVGVDLVLNVENGLLTGQPFANAHMSWANLHYNYHRYNRYLADGVMNDIQESFFSWKPTIKQAVLTIPGCCDLPDPEGYMLTELGESILDHYRANVEKMELDGKDDILSLTLSYST